MLDISRMSPNDIADMVFVFGSNEGGFHGAGAAKAAHAQKGAQYGRGYGHVGNSFAIPTKDMTIKKTLPLSSIEIYVQGFILYAWSRPDLTFQVTCIGCGLAGLQHRDIAPMFKEAPENCYFDEKWRFMLPKAKFWGAA